MLYVFFVLIAIVYNVRKFSRERQFFLDSLINSSATSHRDMILSHHFHVLMFEVFLGFIVAHVISEGTFSIARVGFGIAYLLLICCGLLFYCFGLLFYQHFLKYLERSTKLELRRSFNQHVTKEFRVSFALILLPILLYAVLNWTFQNDSESVGSGFWLIEMLINIVFVSVLTISVTVIIMLRLLPNREITEPEYLEIIQRRLTQIGVPKMRVKWIETDIKNAFVVGIKLLRFSNQTMFIGRNLRTMLTLEEFDAVIAHELAHVANRHIHKRVIELLKNLISGLTGFGILLFLVLTLAHLYFGEDIDLYHRPVTVVCAVICVSWLFFNHSLFYDTIRSHEFESDAYAVIKLGASFPALRSALEKLTSPDEVPDYLKAQKRRRENKNIYFGRISRLFSTHPEISERMSSLELKLELGLPFNHYVSRMNRIRASLAAFTQWKVSLPLACGLLALLTWSMLSLRDGNQLVSFIRKAQVDEILEKSEIRKKINSKPFLVGKSLMYYIVQKQNPELIDFYLQHGADPGRTLIYLTETKNFDLFQVYYSSLGHRLSQDEYYLVLLRSADMNFTKGYRLLVNSSKFENLRSEYKAEFVRNLRSRNTRSPASIKE